VGFLKRDFAKPNEYKGFALIWRNHSDLASSSGCVRFRPFAGFGRSFLAQWNSKTELADGSEFPKLRPGFLVRES
jgi:hypothetical protein